MHSPFNLVVHVLVVTHAVFLLPHHIRLVVRRARARAAKARSARASLVEHAIAAFLIGAMASPALLYFIASVELVRT